ncbi:hypothetical protein G6F62_010107 [Rhizopus arrhizus]|nr:hypothetical protein G6F62_010107 [Rhizopus arrhizus]
MHVKLVESVLITGEADIIKNNVSSDSLLATFVRVKAKFNEKGVIILLISSTLTIIVRKFSTKSKQKFQIKMTEDKWDGVRN